MATSYPIIIIINNTANDVALQIARAASDQILSLNNMTFFAPYGYKVSKNSTGSGQINPGAKNPIYGNELLLGDESNVPAKFVFTVVVYENSIVCTPTSGAFSLRSDLSGNTFTLTLG